VYDLLSCRQIGTGHLEGAAGGVGHDQRAGVQELTRCMEDLQRLEVVSRFRLDEARGVLHVEKSADWHFERRRRKK
jgi:hypothetical protein